MNINFSRCFVTQALMKSFIIVKVKIFADEDISLKVIAPSLNLIKNCNKKFMNKAVSIKKENLELQLNGKEDNDLINILIIL